MTSVEVRDAIAWHGAFSDALGREALRRFLAGEQYGPPHSSLLTPEELLLRAHGRSHPVDALDLTVVAHRVVSGIAWRWIGARYFMVDSELAPDLEDLQSDGQTKVTGRPYAEEARAAITRLAQSNEAAGNKLAKANRRGVDFSTLADEWDVSDDLIGATVGPGAPRWIGPDTISDVDDRDGQRYFRVGIEGAAWYRPA